MNEDTGSSQAAEQLQTTLRPFSQIRPEEFDEAIKRSTIIPAMVEDAMIQRAIPAMIEAMRSQFAQEFRALIPVMVEEVLNKSGHIPSSRCLPLHAKSSASRSLRLLFLGTLPDTLLTFNNIQDEGASIRVELQDSLGSRVQVGPEASVKIKIVVLDGDFEVEDTDHWTDQDFDKNVAQPRKDKGPLLKGNCEIYLSNGVASVTDIAFTDNSKSMRNGKFRLGARVIKGLPHGVEIKEAVSEAFRVKERRVKFYRKRKSQSLEDGTQCLKNIGKTLCNRLAHEQIHTVKDFLQLYHTDEKKLKSILGLQGNNWSELIKDAKSYPLPDGGYQYCDEEGYYLLLNFAFDIVRVTFEGQDLFYRDLAEPKKELINKMRLKAYGKRAELPRISTLTNLTSTPAESQYTVDPVKKPDLLPSKLQMKEKSPFLSSSADNAQTSAQHPGATAADTTKKMPSVIPAISKNGEGRDMCNSTPYQTGQGKQEELLSSLDQTGQHMPSTREAAILEPVTPPKSQVLVSLDPQLSDLPHDQPSAASISQINVQLLDAAPADAATTTPPSENPSTDKMGDGQDICSHTLNQTDQGEEDNQISYYQLYDFALSPNDLYLNYQCIDEFPLHSMDGTQATVHNANGAYCLMSQNNVGSDNLDTNQLALHSLNGTQAMVCRVNTAEYSISKSNVGSDYLSINQNTLGAMDGTQAMTHSANAAEGPMSRRNVGSDHDTDLFTLDAVHGTQAMVHSANAGHVAEVPISQSTVGSGNLGANLFALGPMNGTQSMVHSSNVGDPMSQSTVGSDSLGTGLFTSCSVNGAQAMVHSANAAGDPMSESNGGSKRQRVS